MISKKKGIIPRLHTNDSQDVNNDLKEIKEVLQVIQDLIVKGAVCKNNISKGYYFPSDLIDKSAYTVREYCRNGRINAEKCESGRGANFGWKISHKEYEYYSNNGLRPKKQVV